MYNNPKQECSIQFPKTEKWVDKFSLTNFEVLEYWMKQSFKCIASYTINPLNAKADMYTSWNTSLRYQRRICASSKKQSFILVAHHFCPRLSRRVWERTKSSVTRKFVLWAQNITQGLLIFVTKSNKMSWSLWISVDQGSSSRNFRNKRLKIRQRKPVWNTVMIVLSQMMKLKAPKKQRFWWKWRWCHWRCIGYCKWREWSRSCFAFF